ncbi:CRISPR-associated endoribonuclease Cas6 [Coprobacter sp.]
MRFKLIFTVKSEYSGNVLPVSYQYELSSCIHRMLTGNKELYEQWLRINGFLPEMNIRYRLFSISNFYIPKIKVEADRLFILAKRVQLWISCLPERCTEEFINTLFAGKSLLIGDRHTQVELQVDDIIKTDVKTYPETISYLSLSPIVFVHVRANRSVEYISPDIPGYNEILLNHILEKYRYFYGKDFTGDTNFNFELLTEPKRKGIFIKRFTRDESKIIGYMYKFKLTLHPVLHQLIHNTGLGDKVNLGFGCIEILE